MSNIDKKVLNTALRQLLHLNFGHSVKTLIDASKSQKVKELPFYDAERYQKLQENPVSIISETCAGGYCIITWG